MNDFVLINLFISFAKRMRNERSWLWKIICFNLKLLKFQSQSWDKCEKILARLHSDPSSSSKANNPPSTNQVDLQIIVPVYNVEMTLSECLDSVLSQKTKYSYRITIINDGSTDQSLTIARKYESKSCVDIISQENKGLSGARNTALQHLSGRYVLFLDSDDRLVDGAIDSLMTAAVEHKEIDIVVGGYNEIDLQGKIVRTVKTNRSFPDKKPIGYPWGKVIKSQIFESVSFPERYWFEDTLFSFYLYKKYNVGSIDNIVYDYRQNPEGIVCKASGNPKILDTYYITRSLLSDFAESISCQSLYEEFLSQVVMNRDRVQSLNSEEANRAVFYQTCELKKRYFPNSRSLSKTQKLLERALDKNNYLLYCII